MIGEMTAFHRHLLAAVVTNLARSVAVFMMIMIVLGLPEFFTSGSGRVPSGLVPVLKYLILVFEYVLPPAVLIAALFTVSPLARHHELTALRSAGWSMMRIMSPVLFVGIAAATVSGLLRVANMPPLESLGSDPAAQTVYHARAAYPVTSLVAVVIGICLGATRRERSRYVGFGAAWFLLITFYVVSATANSLGKHGGLPPIVAGWLAPALFLGLSGVLWWRASS